MLSNFRQADGIYQISPPQNFDGGEEAYDQSVGGANRMDLLAHGAGAWRLAELYAKRPLNRWLELGAGGGTCTLGLVAASPEASKIITDTSPTFLRMIRKKLAAAGLSEQGCAFATLDGDDVNQLEPESLDALFVASAVHHISDWRGFIQSSHQALAPGGVLLIQEPFREGYLLMNMAMEIALSASWAQELPRGDIDKIVRCRDSTYYLSDSRAVKEGEDKHNFLVDELTTVGREAGFSQQIFHKNAHFENFGYGGPIVSSSPCLFSAYLLSFLGIHHRLSQEGQDVLARRLTPILRPMDHLYMQGDGPALLASVAFVR